MRETLPFFFAVMAASWILVGMVRRIAVARGVIDHPNERGSHAVPTPRGGGLGVVVAIVIALTAIAWRVRGELPLATILGCVAVASVGWLDDQRGLPVRTRLAVHVLAGAAVGSISIQETVPLAMRIAIFAWWSFWTVSSINVVNFMDGINGFVASQIALFALSLTQFGRSTTASTWYAAAVAAACIGFLPWNFPRARIFLGDVGSGALGFLVPVLALLIMRDQGIDIVRAHLPLLPLFGDGAVTIFRRWRRGEVLTQAHRSHLYQRLANGGMGHTRVTLIYLAASALGAIIAHWGDGRDSWLALCGYVAAIGALAGWLERRIPD